VRRRVKRQTRGTVELLLDSDLAPVFLPQIEREFNRPLYDFSMRFWMKRSRQYPTNIEDLDAFVNTPCQMQLNIFLRIEQLAGPISLET